MTKSLSPIPEDYRTAIPMLAVRDAAGALAFYQTVFDAVEVERIVDDQGSIIHSEIKIGDAQIMVADRAPGHNVTPDETGGTPVIIFMYISDVDEVFGRAVSAGATVVRPVADQFNGNRNGKFRDPFGHVWLLQTRIEDSTSA